MDTDVKKDVARASRRVDCLGSGKDAEMPGIYSEKRAVEETSVEVAPSDVESPRHRLFTRIQPLRHWGFA